MNIEQPIKVKTEIEVVTFFNNDIIDQKILSNFADKKTLLIHEVFSVREQSFRNALIALGWTPPETKGFKNEN